MNRVLSVLPSPADLRSMTRDPGRDLLCGLTVAVVALPLALGFGVSSGLGAAAGLAGAIVAGTLAALCGGSARQVSAPTGAMAVVLVPVVHRHGTAGVLTVGLISGLFLLVLAFARAGAAMAYVPAPVIAGFTLGIAGVIALQQVPNALGVPLPPGEQVALVAARAAGEFGAVPHWPAALLAAGCAALTLAGARRRPTAPFALAAVAAATLAAEALRLPVARLGALPPALPAPSVAFLDVARVPSLLAPAAAVAALVALEALLSASVADAMRPGERHDPSRELFGQGVANLAAPLFGGLPATGAIARTAVNVRTGAVSRLAALAQAVLLAGIATVAAPLVARVPLAALAGVLLATAVRMVDSDAVRAMARATRGDALVLVLTAAATLALDLVRAVLVGLAVSVLLALRAAVRGTRFTPAASDELPGAGSATVTYRFDGPLLFAAAHRFRAGLARVDGVAAVDLRLSGLTAVDATGALALKEAVDELRGRGIAVRISDVAPCHRRILESLGVLPADAAPTRERGVVPSAAGVPAP
ncbi:MULTISPECIES: SulP family inorganic anion transporter [Streptomyces]|uniref:SulP family inorganic anion transporter n=2 Tax=Streptomyces TaxID=1883 RepID=A0ABD5ET49_9ACTN|nr:MULTISPECIES: SulP family inorganic anion transporter [unclassified Streptomyces]MDT0437896.1 SulP family inorganic anion transporter [Streptomyces sp. DSM 41981]MYQ66940.1 STAS domain-containing protein [Streptomyces sp. SID4950]SCE27727.1 sulfate permease, SulP family [Streptomyces sp. SolWspMP-5a-2]